MLDEDASGQEPLNKTARLLAGELGFITRTRIAFGLIGGVMLPALYLLTPTAALGMTSLALCVSGELLERYLYFTAVVTRKMPGGIGA